MRLERGEMVVQQMAAGDPGVGTRSSADPRGDADSGWVDITRLGYDGSLSGWRIQLAAWPPPTAELDAADTVVSYGLVFETTGDDAADYVVGIKNDAPAPGGSRLSERTRRLGGPRAMTISPA